MEARGSGMTYSSPKKKKTTKNSISAKLSLQNQGDIKTFPNKQKQSLLPEDLPYKKY